MPSPKLSPRQGNSRRLDVALVLTAAAQLVDRDGPEALTLTSLANELGIKPPSLYAHVESLAALRKQTAVLGLEELERALLRAGFAKTAEAALHAMFRAYREFGLKRPGLYATTYLWTGPENPKALEISSRIGSAVMQALDPLFDGLEKEERIHRLRIMRVALHGFTSLESAKAFWEPTDLGDTFQHLLNSLEAIAKAR